MAGTLVYREVEEPDGRWEWAFSDEEFDGGKYMIGKRVKVQWLVPKGDLSFFQIAKVYGGTEVDRRVDGRLVTFTLVPEREVMRLTVTQHYDSYDVRKRKEEYSLQGAFIDNECALKRCRGSAPGLGFQGWFFNLQSWAPTCGKQTTVAGAELAYYFTGYASLSESLASAESFASAPAAGVRRWLTVGGANGVAGNDVCGTADQGLWCKAMLKQYTVRNVRSLLGGSSIGFEGVLFDFEKSTEDVTIRSTTRAINAVVRAGYKAAVTVSSCMPRGWTSSSATASAFARAWGRDMNLEFFSPRMYNSEGETYATTGCQADDWRMLRYFHVPIVPATPRLSDLEEYFNTGTEESGNPDARVTKGITAGEAIAWYTC